MFYIVYEAVLPLPTCMKEEGCRSIIERKDSNDGFDLDGDFVISTKVLNTLFLCLYQKHLWFQFVTEDNRILIINFILVS